MWPVPFSTRLQRAGRDVRTGWHWRVPELLFCLAEKPWSKTPVQPLGGHPPAPASHPSAPKLMSPYSITDLGSPKGTGNESNFPAQPSLGRIPVCRDEHSFGKADSKTPRAWWHVGPGPVQGVQSSRQLSRGCCWLLFPSMGLTASN